MSKALLIAEKPDLMRKIKSVYDKNRSKIPYDITFTAQAGHLVTLKMPDEIDPEQKVWKWENLPFHPEDHGGWQYKTIKDKYSLYENIKNEIKSGNYDFVIHAGDPDQEGELLIRLVLSYVKNTLPVKRFWTNDLSEVKIVDALLNLKDDDHDTMLVNLLSAAYARQHSDYRFGMNISEAASLKMRTRVACGRVKTPILGIICKRELEIKNFKPSTCYGVKSIYRRGFDGQLFDNSVQADPESEEAKDEKSVGLLWFETKGEAENVIAGLSSKATVVEFTTKRTESLPPKLFKLSAAQVAAGKLGYDADRTLEIIQSLYEKAFVTYPRTGCEYVSSLENFSGMLAAASSIPELAPYISSITSVDIARVKGTKKWVNDKALTEAGHSALCPTTVKPDLSKLSADELAIYKLICRQFVAIFLPPLVQDKTLLITEVNGNTFKSTGKTVVDEGFSKIFGTKFTDTVIPSCTKGDVLEVETYDVIEKTTTCPKRFTNPDLIAACEAPHKYLTDTTLKSLGKKLRIGTDSTRAGIIKTLINVDKYLAYSTDKKTKYIIPTDMGMTIYLNLKDCDICKVDLTGEWEEKLEMVRSGSLSLKEIENGMRTHVEQLIEDIKNANMSVVAKAKNPTVCGCPLCGKDIISSTKGYFCSGYKDGCKIVAYKELLGAKITDEEFKILINGGIIKKTLKKENKSWPQKLRYDLEEFKYEFVKDELQGNDLSCPKCGEGLLENDRYVKCNSCDFILWKTICGKELSSSNTRDLLISGITHTIKGFRSKTGKKFDAKLKMKGDFSGVEFVFSEKKKKKWY